MSVLLGAADFELSAYQSRFKGEVLIQVDQNFARVDARNAERTVVDGIEAATSFRLANNLSGRLAYAYESARFRSDPVYGNNRLAGSTRSEEHTSELQSLIRTSYSVFSLKQIKTPNRHHTNCSH